MRSFKVVLFIREPLLFAVVVMCLLTTVFFGYGQLNSWIWHQQILPVVVWLPLGVLLALLPVNYDFTINDQGELLGQYAWFRVPLFSKQRLGCDRQTVVWHLTDKSVAQVGLGTAEADIETPLFSWRVGGRVTQRLDHLVYDINSSLGMNLKPYRGS
ncbi:hypothetical protein [Ferrimonas kyonanensis]|uniref:hypothetical protein n=1 Tax=Ferrimonas kyonanensis TaxID=364763 RepID=UPI00041F3625|nr:hypothetical protein [Ferrimonas kyonanensis]